MVENGILVIDKPAGVTSFGVVSRVRRVLGIKKVGHAGTLDPFATGVLIVCAGRPATKLIPKFMETDKEYLATACLGVETSTQDIEGAVVGGCAPGELDSLQVDEVLNGFSGVQWQKPPAYSALKHQGKPLYYYARKGIEVEKDPRRIIIHEIERQGELTRCPGGTVELTFRVVSSKGTYIRTLASDIGRVLGCGAHLIRLRRTRCGPFRVDDTIQWEALTSADALRRCNLAMIGVEEVGNVLQYSAEMASVCKNFSPE